LKARASPHGDGLPPSSPFPPPWRSTFPPTALLRHRLLVRRALSKNPCRQLRCRKFLKHPDLQLSRPFIVP
jgi:hypothetical protein